MTDNDISTLLAEKVFEAAAARSSLAIRGSGSKQFLTGETNGTVLDITSHRGIVSYEPTELVLTARAGTPLSEIEAVLAENHQILGSEPPHFGPGATLGGTIACNLSGPRRPYCGATRDFVLGTRIVNGRGEMLGFGGQVMKNVAGYDVSRLMTGSRGTLGVILEVSLKVLPRPAQEITLTFQMGAEEAVQRMNTWAGWPLPLSATVYDGEILYVRLSGSDAGVRAARVKLGGDFLEKSKTFWKELREQQLSFFRNNTPLWRLSVPPATAPIDLPGKWLLDWGGAQRWLKTDISAQDMRKKVSSAGGFAMPYHAIEMKKTQSVELSNAVQGLQRNIKLSFDPENIFNTA